MSEVHTTRHMPVLLEAVVKNLRPQPGAFGIDATLGGGGHALSLFQGIEPGGRLLVMDRDAEAVERFQARIQADPILKKAEVSGALMLCREKYSELTKELEKRKLPQADFILADLGFSSDQIEDPARGFSFREDGPLDMRLDQGEGRTARALVNEATESELRGLLQTYGGEREAGRIARAIIRTREAGPIETTAHLKDLIEAVYPKGAWRRLSIHPATKTFQALRMAVNGELDEIQAFLPQALKRLKPGGRLAIITFHSGEDELVKKFFREQATGCICPPGFPICRCGRQPLIRLLTKKPIIASESERLQNPRSRSAKLRVVEKV